MHKKPLGGHKVPPWLEGLMYIVIRIFFFQFFLTVISNTAIDNFMCHKFFFRRWCQEIS